MLPSPVYQIASFCYHYGIRDVVVSPGSRSAPLVLAFTRHKGFRVLYIPDERAAAFIALGLSIVSGQTTVLICTSGTAPLHYTPAIAEAHAQHIPLLILSANRPPEWMQQQEGQTIPPYSWYGDLVKHSYTFPDTYAHTDIRWHAERILHEALVLSTQTPRGPVHIDIPIREPFYPQKNQKLVHEKPARMRTPIPATPIPSDKGWKILETLFAQHSRILILSGQELYDKNIQRRFEDFYAQFPVVLLGDILSNLHGLPMCLRYADLVLKENARSSTHTSIYRALRPNLLITFGKSVLSKELKNFLRTYPPQAHVHLHSADMLVPDTFQHLTHVLNISPSAFFLGCKKYISSQVIATAARTRKAFLKRWETADKQAAQHWQQTITLQPFSACTALQEVLQHLPGYCYLHLANSMCVRYAQWMGLQTEQKAVAVYANRGTSGIDGCLSTALGAAIQSEYVPNVLIIGDLAFFHDRNALWHTHVPANLKIVLLNDHGGGIFRHIKEVIALPECENYFVGPQKLSASHAAKEYGLSYFHASNTSTLSAQIKDFFRPRDRASLLEIETDGKKDARVVQKMMQSL